MPRKIFIPRQAYKYVNTTTDLDGYTFSSGTPGNSLDLEKYIKEVSGAGEATPITYNSLLNLANTGQLVPGGVYLMTDFQTIHHVPLADPGGGQNSYSSAADYGDDYLYSGPVEPLYVIAISESALHPQVVSKYFPKDEIYYSLNPDEVNSIISGLNLGSYLGTASITYYGSALNSKGVIEKRIDPVANIIGHYDWRSCKFAKFTDNTGTGTKKYNTSQGGSSTWGGSDSDLFFTVNAATIVKEGKTFCDPVSGGSRNITLEPLGFGGAANIGGSVSHMLPNVVFKSVVKNADLQQAYCGVFEAATENFKILGSMLDLTYHAAINAVVIGRLDLSTFTGTVDDCTWGFGCTKFTVTGNIASCHFGNDNKGYTLGNGARIIAEDGVGRNTAGIITIGNGFADIRFESGCFIGLGSLTAGTDLQGFTFKSLCAATVDIANNVAYGHTGKEAPAFDISIGANSEHIYQGDNPTAAFIVGADCRSIRTGDKPSRFECGDNCGWITAGSESAVTTGDNCLHITVGDKGTGTLTIPAGATNCKFGDQLPFASFSFDSVVLTNIVVEDDVIGATATDNWTDVTLKAGSTLIAKAVSGVMIGNNSDIDTGGKNLSNSTIGMNVTLDTTAANIAVNISNLTVGDNNSLTVTAGAAQNLRGLFIMPKTFSSNSIDINNAANVLFTDAPVATVSSDGTYFHAYRMEGTGTPAFNIDELVVT